MIAQAIVLASAAPSIFGTWCGPEGDALWIEQEGIGTSEHSYCTFDEGQPADATSLQSPMTCTTFRLNEKLERVPFAHSSQFAEAEMTDPDHIKLNYRDGRAPVVLTRCEE